MRVLIIQEKSRHEKNINFRESENLKRALLKTDIICEVWGLGHENFNISFETIVKNFDVLLCIENYDNGWIPDLSSYKNKLKIFWSIDSHCILQKHIAGAIKNNRYCFKSIEDHNLFKPFCKTHPL